MGGRLVNDLTEHCGNCVTADRAVTVTPYLIQPDDEHGARAYYRCGECGARWWTSWLVGTEALAATHDPRSAA
jgi:hypothetical protein